MITINPKQISKYIHWVNDITMKHALDKIKECDDAMSTHSPKYRRPVPPPPPIGGYQPIKSTANPQPPNTGSNVRPNPNYTPPASVKETCTYETPCGWCSKWDKKCDKQIPEVQPDNTTPCRDCARYQFDMAECKNCNAENNFQYFKKW